MLLAPIVSVIKHGISDFAIELKLDEHFKNTESYESVRIFDNDSYEFHFAKNIGRGYRSYDR